MSNTLGRTWLALATAALVSTGCFKLARTSPPVERYVLGGARFASADAATRDSAGLAIGLRRLDLAPYLATLAIVVRRADNEIVTSGFHRWAESPAAGLNRAMSGYLAAAPSIRSIDVAPWPIRSDQDYIVQLHVGRLEGVESGAAGARAGEAHLLVQWEIIRPRDGALLARGTTDHRAVDWVVGEYGALVSLLDQGLVVLARDIVACLGSLGPPVPADSVLDAVDRGATIECVRR